MIKIKILYLNTKSIIINIKTGAVKVLVFFVAFVERGREKRHLKIHFTNKEEDSGILPANNVVKTKKKG